MAGAFGLRSGACSQAAIGRRRSRSRAPWMGPARPRSGERERRNARRTGHVSRLRLAPPNGDTRGAEHRTFRRGRPACRARPRSRNARRPLLLHAKCVRPFPSPTRSAPSVSTWRRSGSSSSAPRVAAASVGEVHAEAGGGAGDDRDLVGEPEGVEILPHRGTGSAGFRVSPRPSAPRARARRRTTAR